MGLAGWWRRSPTEELMREVMRVSAQQVEVTNRIAEIFDRMTSLWEVTGPPEARHMTDEREAEIFEQEARHE